MKKILIFIAGVAVGATITNKLVKDKYAQMAQEEIDSVKERFMEPKNKDTDDVKECAKPKVDDTCEEKQQTHDSKANYYNYAAQYQSVDDKKENKEVEKPVETKKDVDRPYVITPDEFGELDEYECISLSYFDDNVLTDDDYDLVDDVDSIVGLESLTHFGEYEDDSVFVRNDRLKCDYEILLDHRRYSDIIEEMPYLMRY